MGGGHFENYLETLKKLKKKPRVFVTFSSVLYVSERESSFEQFPFYFTVYSSDRYIPMKTTCANRSSVTRDTLHARDTKSHRLLQLEWISEGIIGSLVLRSSPRGGSEPGSGPAVQRCVQLSIARGRKRVLNKFPRSRRKQKTVAVWRSAPLASPRDPLQILSLADS